MTTTFAITGAAGFIGRYLTAALRDAGFSVRALSQHAIDVPGADVVRYGGLHDRPGLQRAFERVDVVVHLAARVHVMRETAGQPLEAFRLANVEGTRSVMAAAHVAGVRSVIMTSTVKVMGEANDQPWVETDSPAPTDPYGISKLEAEQALSEMGAQAGINTVALRLPLVYGPGVRANMLRLFQMVDRGWPLLLGGINNQRSLLYVGNLAAAIQRLTGSLQGHHTFFVSDGDDVSTSRLVQEIGRALDKPVRLLPAPVGLLKASARARLPLVGAVSHRLVSSLAIDASALRRVTGPLPFSLRDGLAETAAWYRSARHV